MYKVGNEVLVKAKIAEFDLDRMMYLCELLEGDCFIRFYCPKGFIADKTYESGLKDAWELADKVYEMRNQQRYDVFGTESLAKVMDLSPQEALAKIEAYEKEKEIKVGDVVVQRDTQKKFLVVTEEDDSSVYEFGVIDLETLMLDRICNDTKIFQKTGKHIDIESLLRQIGE